jgi:hypothetical protein
VNPDTGKVEFTHDPCLTHDIFWIDNGKLFSFHIARAHNTVNAYPENIFGLHDAYVMTVRNELGLATGDMFMLSSRANILLLTEEQRTKKILAEPSKGVQTKSIVSGPYQLNTPKPASEIPAHGVVYWYGALSENNTEPGSATLKKLRNYQGVDTLERAISYLEEKGVSHNNPVLTEYDPRLDDPQGEWLVSLQANAYAGKIYVTAVFLNRDYAFLEEDKQLVQYIATQHAKRLNVELGDATLFYVK